jgi:hypothetical protein
LADTEPDTIVDPFDKLVSITLLLSIASIFAIFPIIVSDYPSIKNSPKSLLNLNLNPTLFLPKHCESLNLY